MNLLKELAKKPLDMTILYTSDENSQRKEIVRILSLIFPKVIVAVDINEAVEYFSNHKVDLLLSDLKNLDQNDDDLIKELRKQNQNLPVLVVANDEEKSSYDIDDYIKKPLQLNSFLDILDKTIEKIQKSKCDGY